MPWWLLITGCLRYLSADTLPCAPNSANSGLECDWEQQHDTLQTTRHSNAFFSVLNLSSPLELIPSSSYSPLVCSFLVVAGLFFLLFSLFFFSTYQLIHPHLQTHCRDFCVLQRAKQRECESAHGLIEVNPGSSNLPVSNEEEMRDGWWMVKRKKEKRSWELTKGALIVTESRGRCFFFFFFKAAMWWGEEVIGLKKIVCSVGYK